MTTCERLLQGDLVTVIWLVACVVVGVVLGRRSARDMRAAEGTTDAMQWWNWVGFALIMAGGTVWFIYICGSPESRCSSVPEGTFFALMPRALLGAIASTWLYLQRR